jgi:predicted acetyltransferase
MAIRVRTVRDLEEYMSAIAPITHYFGDERNPERAERFSHLLPFERMHAAVADGAFVAGAGVLPFELTVPGGPVPCAGVTVVGVLPTHRRRGLLTRLMRAQLEDIRERGEPLAALWASEETIYGRYGYGIASLDAMLRATRVHAALRPDLPSGGSVRLVSKEEALRVLPRIHERVRRQTVGFLSRSPAWWECRTLFDDPERRRGGGVLNQAVLQLDGRAAGYALYRIKPGFEDATNTGQVEVVEAIGDSPAATRELWRFLLGIDWIQEIRCEILPVDHPLLLLVQRPNKLNWKVFDGIWLRLVDVGAALSARSYAADGRVTFEVRSDPVFADNQRTWTVDGGVVRRTARRADVRLDVQALAAAYLGGFSFAELARAGRVEEVARGGLARADALFRVDAKPWCPEIF